MKAARFNLPPDLLALVARWKARKPRSVQRAEHRRKRLAVAEAAYRAARLVPSERMPPNPPTVVS